MACVFTKLLAMLLLVASFTLGNAQFPKSKPNHVTRTTYQGIEDDNPFSYSSNHEDEDWSYPTYEDKDWSYEDLETSSPLSTSSSTPPPTTTMTTTLPTTSSTTRRMTSRRPSTSALPRTTSPTTTSRPTTSTTTTSTTTKTTSRPTTSTTTTTTTTKTTLRPTTTTTTTTSTTKASTSMSSSSTTTLSTSTTTATTTTGATMATRPSSSIATGHETRESFPSANGSPYDYELEEEEEEIRESMGDAGDGDNFGDGGQDETSTFPSQPTHTDSSLPPGIKIDPLCPLHLSHCLINSHGCKSQVKYYQQELYRQKELLRKWHSGTNVPRTFRQMEQELEASMYGEKEGKKEGEIEGEKEQEPRRKGVRPKLKHHIGWIYIGVVKIVAVSRGILFVLMVGIFYICYKRWTGPSFSACNYCRECGQAVWRTLDRLFHLRSLKDSPQVSFSRLLKGIRENPITEREQVEMRDLQIPCDPNLTHSSNVSNEESPDDEREPLVEINDEEGLPRMSSRNPTPSPPPPPPASSPPPLIHAEGSGGEEEEEGNGGSGMENDEGEGSGAVNATENE